MLQSGGNSNDMTESQQHRALASVAASQLLPTFDGGTHGLKITMNTGTAVKAGTNSGGTGDGNTVPGEARFCTAQACTFALRPALDFAMIRQCSLDVHWMKYMQVVCRLYCSDHRLPVN
jgi:hypothetical protein